MVVSQNDDRQLAKLYDAVAATHFKLKEYQKALENYLETVNICLRFLKENHHMIFEYYVVISEIYACIGDQAKAQEYNKKSASDTIMHNMYQGFGDKKGKAEKYRQRATKITKHSQMKEYQELISQKRYPEALQFQLELLQASENFCNSFNTLDVYLSNIGFLYYCLKENQKALEFYQKALKIRKRLYGHEHQEVANSYNSIGNIYQDIGEYKKALEFYQLALNIYKLYGEHHAHVGIALNNMGLILYKLGSHQEAMKNYQQALEILNSMYANGHPNIATIYNNMGDVSSKQYDFVTALKWYQKSLQIWKLFFDNNHFEVLKCYKNLRNVLEKLGQSREALNYHQQAIHCKDYKDLDDEYISMLRDKQEKQLEKNENCMLQ